MPSKHVIALIRCGLGNQMFIYAAARRLALKNDARLVLLTDLFDDEYHGRSFLLDRFSIAGEIFTLRDLGISYSQGKHKFARRVDRYLHLLGLYHKEYVIERRKRLFSSNSSLYDGRLLNLRFADHVFLDGYWQNEIYFSDIAEIIRSDFRLGAEPGSLTRELAREINAVNAVCVHFRRTELEQQDMIKAHRLEENLHYKQGLDMTYYMKAIRIISEKVANPHFYCFSDYPEWMAKNVTLPGTVTYVTHNNSADLCHEDMFLMSQCRHHIISHSTFGWWGAWLSGHPGKIVIAPINTCSRPKSPFYPREWHTIDVCQRNVISKD